MSRKALRLDAKLLGEMSELVGPADVVQYVERAIRREIEHVRHTSAYHEHLPPQLRNLEDDVLSDVFLEISELVGPDGITEYVERALRNELRWGSDREQFPDDFTLTEEQDPAELLDRWLAIIRDMVGSDGLAEYVEQATRKELRWGDGKLGELMDDLETQDGPLPDELVAEAQEFAEEARAAWGSE